MCGCNGGNDPTPKPERRGIVERLETKIDEVLREVRKHGDNIRTTGDWQNTEFINDRGGGAVKGDVSREDSISLVYEKGCIRSIRESDRTIPPKALTIHIFSDTPLVVLQTDGNLQFRGVRR